MKVEEQKNLYLKDRAQTRKLNKFYTHDYLRYTWIHITACISGTENRTLDLEGLANNKEWTQNLMWLGKDSIWLHTNQQDGLRKWEKSLTLLNFINRWNFGWLLLNLVERGMFCCNILIFEEDSACLFFFLPPRETTQSR